MKHVLSIYKFSFPFIEYRYEKAIFHELISDFEKKLKYHGIYIKTSDIASHSYICKAVYFEGGRCDFFLHDAASYHLPSSQYELYFENQISLDITKELIKIFQTVGLDHYIFDVSAELDDNILHKDMITLQTLEKNFKKFDEKELKKFLTHTNKKYLSETLRQNKQMRDSFYYMIYNCYIFYQNYQQSQKRLAEIDEIMKGDISIEYGSILDLSAKRLEHITLINISTFKKYSSILDSFFDLLK